MSSLESSLFSRKTALVLSLITALKVAFKRTGMLLNAFIRTTARKTYLENQSAQGRSYTVVLKRDNIRYVLLSVHVTY